MDTSRGKEDAVNENAQEIENPRATSSKWTELRARYTATPALKERYERNQRALALMRHILMEVDAEREQAGVSKAELARRIGTHPSAIRRLFSTKSSNPTLLTVLGILDALDIDLRLAMKRTSPDNRQADEHDCGANRQEKVPA